MPYFCIESCIASDLYWIQAVKLNFTSQIKEATSKTTLPPNAVLDNSFGTDEKGKHCLFNLQGISCNPLCVPCGFLITVLTQPEPGLEREFWQNSITRCRWKRLFSGTVGMSAPNDGLRDKKFKMQGGNVTEKKHALSTEVTSPTIRFSCLGIHS